MARAAVANRAAVQPSQNLIVRSEELDNAAWVRTALTSVDANVAAGPVALGSPLRASRLVASAGANRHSITGTSLLTSPALRWFCASMWFKADTHGFAGISVDGGTSVLNVGIDLATGGIIGVTQANVADTRVVSTNGGGGWWLLEVAMWPTMASAGFFGVSFAGVASAAGSIFWNAAGGESVLAIGASAAFANHRGSYVRTVAAALDLGPMRNRVDANRAAAIGRVAV